MNRVVGLIGVLVGLGCSPSGGGTTQTCGEAKSGEPCQAQSECACGLSCVDAKCLKVVNTAANPVTDRRVTTPPPTPTQLVSGFCDWMASSTCSDKPLKPEKVEKCKQEGAVEEAVAAEAGCASQFAEQVDCVKQAWPGCDEAKDDALEEAFDGCEPKAQALKTCVKATCIESNATCSSFASSGARPDPEDTTEPSEAQPVSKSGCHARRKSTCDKHSSAKCDSVADSSGTLYSCTCDDSEVSFHIYAADCCSIAEVLPTHCGWTEDNTSASVPPSGSGSDATDG